MGGKLSAVVLLITAATMFVWWAVPFAVEAAPDARGLNQPPPPPPPPPPTEPPEPTSPPPKGGKTEGGGHGGGSSRFMHCNSTISGFVTNYADKSPGAGVVVEIGNSGWKSSKPADTNGYFYFGGLCEGTAYVKVLIPERALATNPYAEAVLDGKNHVEVDLGYFPPPSMPERGDGQDMLPSPGSTLTTLPRITPPVSVVPGATRAVAMATPAAPFSGKPRFHGVAVELSAPRTVRPGMKAEMTVAVRNGGPGPATGTVVYFPLAPGVMLQEADTSRGSLRIQSGPQGAARKTHGVNAPVRASTLVVDVGDLATEETVLITTKVQFKPDVTPGDRTEFRAEVKTQDGGYASDVAFISLTEAGSVFQLTLPTTGVDTYRQYLHRYLW